MNTRERITMAHVEDSPRASIEEWGRRLDTRERSMPTLELAYRLGVELAVPPRPAPDFKHELRNRLLSRHEARSMRIRRLAAGALATLAVLAGLLVGLDVLREGAGAVSAQELLERADGSLMEGVSTEDIVHDRWLVDVSSTPTVRFKAVAEVWQSLDGGQFRYELEDSVGRLIYFVQRDAERVWRSKHAGSIGASPVDQVYTMGWEEYVASDMAALEQQAEVLPPLFGDLSNLLLFDTWLRGRVQGCVDVFCLVGLPSSASWECRSRRCELALSEGTQLEAEVREVLTGEGRKVAVVEFRARPDGELVRAVTIDTAASQLLGITAYAHGREIARLTHLGRQVLDAADLPSGFFSSLPASLEVVAQQEGKRTPAPGISGSPLFDAPETVAVKSVSPAPGTELTGQIEFEVTLEYYLESEPEADLVVGLGTGLFSGLCVDLPCGKARIERGRGAVTVRFTATIGPDMPDRVMLVVRMRTEREHAFINTLGWAFEDLSWTLRP